MQQIDPLIHQHIEPPLQSFPFLCTKPRLPQLFRQLMDTLLQQSPASLIFLDHLFHICPPVSHQYKFLSSFEKRRINRQCSTSGIGAIDGVRPMPPC